MEDMEDKVSRPQLRFRHCRQWAQSRCHTRDCLDLRCGSWRSPHINVWFVSLTGRAPSS